MGFQLFLNHRQNPPVTPDSECVPSEAYELSYLRESLACLDPVFQVVIKKIYAITQNGDPIASAHPQQVNLRSRVTWVSLGLLNR